jgi:hypothetical protein
MNDYTNVSVRFLMTFFLLNTVKEELGVGRIYKPLYFRLYVGNDTRHTRGNDRNISRNYYVNT